MPYFFSLGGSGDSREREEPHIHSPYNDENEYGVVTQRERDNWLAGEPTDDDREGEHDWWEPYEDDRK